MNKDAVDIRISEHVPAAARREAQAAPVLAYVLFGALAFPIVLGAALLSGLGFLDASLAAVTLSGPAALVIYGTLVLLLRRTTP
jgi:hypothetical protein